jgi:hypothetical protein
MADDAVPYEKAIEETGKVTGEVAANCISSNFYDYPNRSLVLNARRQPLWKCPIF